MLNGLKKRSWAFLSYKQLRAFVGMKASLALRPDVRLSIAA